MKAALLKAPGVVAVEEIDRPVLLEGQVLLRVLAAGVCQTDCHIRKHPFATDFGTTLGHEIAGEVVEAGPGVGGWKTGDRVVVHPCWACMKCAQCRAGRENYCEGHGMARVPPPTPGVTRNGGMAHYIAAPATSLVAIGDVDPAFAAILPDAGLAPYHSVRSLRDALVPGTSVLVIGTGGLGQFAVQFLRLLTASKVVALDISAKARDIAVDLGADVAIDASAQDAAAQILATTGGTGMTAVLDFVGTDSSLRLAASVIAPAGSIRVVGLNNGSIPFEAADISSIALPWGVSLTKPYSGSYRDLAEVIALAEAGRLRTNITTFPLEEASRALDLLEAGQIEGRAVLLPQMGEEGHDAHA